MFTKTLLGAAAIAFQAVGAIPTISAVGSKFFTSDGNQFFIKGIAYQLVPADPLIDTAQCTRDANLMKTLGANAIRVYHVDPTANHDGCMNAFSDNGIYLFLDLDTFTTQINAPAPTFSDSQFAAFAAVFDAFQKYNNLAGVFVGNEVLTQPNDSPAAPYVKAATANIKAYRDRMKYRKIPVGYSAADIATLRPMLQDYLVCGNNASQSIDFFGLNAYEWCGPQNFQTSGYQNLQNMAKGFPVPIFFSETGCITAPPRTFQEMGTIFGPEMGDTWSGAIVYEWIQEDNSYGLISYGPGGPGNFVRSGTPTPIAPDFTNLQSQWAAVKPTGVQLSAYSASVGAISTPACPGSTAGSWEISGNPPLPVIGQAYVPTMTQAPDAGSAGSTAAIAGSSASASASGASASGTSTATKAGANGGKEIAGMSIGLAGVLLGFLAWL